jgi:hypothetical protein
VRVFIFDDPSQSLVALVPFNFDYNTLYKLYSLFK